MNATTRQECGSGGLLWGFLYEDTWQSYWSAFAAGDQEGAALLESKNQAERIAAGL